MNRVMAVLLPHCEPAIDFSPRPVMRDPRGAGLACLSGAVPDLRGHAGHWEPSSILPCLRGRADTTPPQASLRTMRPANRI